MWFVESMASQMAHLWHKNYSVRPINVLEKLGCIVTSKILVIGTAKRNWNLFMDFKSGYRDTTIIIKFNQKVFIYGANHQLKSRIRHTRLIVFGRLCNDCYFKGCKMDIFLWKSLIHWKHLSPMPMVRWVYFVHGLKPGRIIILVPIVIIYFRWGLWRSTAVWNGLIPKNIIVLGLLILIVCNSTIIGVTISIIFSTMEGYDLNIFP